MAALNYVGSRRGKVLFAGGVYAGLLALTAAFLFPLLFRMTGFANICVNGVGASAANSACRHIL